MTAIDIDGRARRRRGAAARAWAVAGVDVGATKIEVVIADAALQVRARRKTPTPARGGPAAVVEAITATVQHAAAEIGDPLVALGAGVPGEVDVETGTVARSPNIRGWTAPFPLRDELAQRLKVPVAIENDVRAALLGEHRQGAAAGHDDVLAVWFGTGVGGAVLLGGSVRQGRLGAAGEIGHACAVAGGRRCACGNRGCLEAYAGRAAMERRARERAEKGEKTVLFTLMKKSSRTRLTSGVIAQALNEGDRLANELINEAVRAAGPVIASAVNVLDPDIVVIGGGLGSRLGNPFARRIARSMHPHLLNRGRRAIALVPAGLGDLSGALGGATMAVDLHAAREPGDAGARDAAT